VELERCIYIVVAMVREDIKELPDQVKALASDVGDLKDRADAFRDKLRSGVDTLLTILDKDGNFSRAW
jgi:hypothetical protein